MSRTLAITQNITLDGVIDATSGFFTVTGEDDTDDIGAVMKGHQDRADVFLAGVLPTPAAAILVRKHGFDLGAVVSASHNPWRDNGIKFFARGGRKLPDAVHIMLIWLASRSCIAGVPPRYGTSCHRTPSMSCIDRPHRCWTVPAPTVPCETLPGLAFIQSTSSLSVLAGTSLLVTRMNG